MTTKAGKGRARTKAPKRATPPTTTTALVPRRNRTPLAVKEAFVELRAQGLPIKRVAEELGVSTKTLVVWGKELRDEIANLRAVELELLREKFYLATERRMELFGGVLKQIRTELENRDLADVPTALLIKLLLDTHEALRAEDVEPVIRTEEEIEQDRAAELVLMRLTAGTAPARLTSSGSEPEGDL